jgi:hypothetical protein
MDFQRLKMSKCAPVNRCFAAPPSAGQQFGRSPHTQPCSPAPVADLALTP